jgi:cytosine deaminase
MVDLIICGCRVEEWPQIVNVAIDAGRIVDIGPTTFLPAGQHIVPEGNVLLPGFVNPHVHLDKAFVGGLAPSGLMLDGVTRGTELKRGYTREDIKARARRALDIAVRHGVTALRSPVDVDPIVGTHTL